MEGTSNQNPPPQVSIVIPMPIIPPLPFPFDRPFPILPPHPQMFHPSMFVSRQLHCSDLSPSPIFASVQPDCARVPEIPQTTKDSAASELKEEYNDEEEDVFVMTDEWVEFFAKSEARRKEGACGSVLFLF